MKKFSRLSSSLLLTAMVVFLFMACQKEQNTAATDNAAAAEANVLKGVSGTFDGSIDAGYAAALAKNFAKKYDDADQTLQVAFPAKELSAFLASLQTNQKSTTIYVNFGVYGKGAQAPLDKDNGRMTVFFTGDKGGRASGSTRVNAADDAYLNHGEIFP